MTEEVQAEQPQGVNITVEQILAAIINTVGTTTVPLDNLVQNYGNKQIAVNQNEDKSVTFSLADVPTQTETTTVDSE
jgi:hypothetical protein